MPTIRGSAKDEPPIIRAVVQPVTQAALFNPSERSDGIDCRALLDTGADGTSITRHLAEIAQLPRRAKIQASGLSGSGWHRSWATFVGVYAEDEIGALPLIFPEPMLAIEVSPYPAFDMIIGRDLLTLGRFTLEPSGEFIWELPNTF